MFVRLFSRQNCVKTRQPGEVQLYSVIGANSDEIKATVEYRMSSNIPIGETETPYGNAFDTIRFAISKHCF
jgi:hypothetical protein